MANSSKYVSILKDRCTESNVHHKNHATSKKGFSKVFDQQD